MPKLNGLSLKQRTFAQAYTDYGNQVTFGNAKESARAAKYKGNDHTLEEIGSQNLRKVVIKAEIDRIEAKREEKAEDRRQVLSKRLDHTYAKADTKADCASMVAACRADAKLRGLETDVGRTEGDQQRELTEHQAAMGRKLAKAAIELELAELRKASIKATEVA